MTVQLHWFISFKMLHSHFCLFLQRVQITKKGVVVTVVFILSCVFYTLIWHCSLNILNNDHYMNKFGFFFCSSEDNCLNRDFSTVNWDKWLASATLTGNQLVQYFLWTNHSSCQLSHDFGGVMMRNPSGLAGQKAVCIDKKVAPIPGKCLVYSFGINNEWSFDENMANYGCQVFAFDPSMGIDHHDHSPGNVHFYNWALGDRNEYDHSLNWTILSLSSIYETLSSRHGSKVIDYLKLDIEYSEWIALPHILKSGMLSKIRQLGIEIHLDVNYSLEQHRKWAKLLRSIEKNGMIRFDSEYNPWYTGNFTKFPFTGSLGYEIAWYNSNLFHDII